MSVTPTLLQCLCSYAIMQKCWHTNPAERPVFSELQHTFADMLLEEVSYIELSSLTDSVYVRPPATDTR